MNYIKLFEAFEKNISGVVKFLDNLDDKDSGIFLNCLEKISRKYDIGLSDIEGKYVRSNIAKKIGNQSECITIWFSLKDGLTITTKNESPSDSWQENDGQNWITPEVGNFINNNSAYHNNTLSLKSFWRHSEYISVQKSDFALIIDLDKCKKGLSDLKRKRSEEILPRIDDHYYRELNKKRWNKKLNREPISKYNRHEFSKWKRLFYDLDYNRSYRGSKSMLMDKIISLYDSGNISYSELSRIINNFY